MNIWSPLFTLIGETWPRCGCGGRRRDTEGPCLRSPTIHFWSGRRFFFNALGLSDIFLATFGYSLGHLSIATVFWTLREPQRVNVSGATSQSYDIFSIFGTYSRGHNIATISWALFVWVAHFGLSTYLVLAWFTISLWPNFGTFLLTQLCLGRNLLKLFRRNQGLHFPKRVLLHIKSFLSFIMQLDYWDSCSWTWP